MKSSETSIVSPIRVNLSISNGTHQNRGKSDYESFNPMNEPIDENDFFKEGKPAEYNVEFS
jgi:hypothetical protein